MRCGQRVPWAAFDCQVEEPAYTHATLPDASTVEIATRNFNSAASAAAQHRTCSRRLQAGVRRLRQPSQLSVVRRYLQGGVRLFEVGNQSSERRFLVQAFEMWINQKEGRASKPCIDTAFEPGHRLVRI